MIDSTTAYGWIVKGLGGSINIVKMLVDDGLEVTPHWFEELRKCKCRLDELVLRVKVKQD